MSYPLHPKVAPKHVKNHRAKYFIPVYERDGFETQAAYDLEHWGEALCKVYANEEGHPRRERAQAALATIKA